MYIYVDVGYDRWRTKYFLCLCRDLVCKIDWFSLNIEGYLSFLDILCVKYLLERWDVDQNEFQMAVV